MNRYTRVFKLKPFFGENHHLMLTKDSYQYGDVEWKYTLGSRAIIVPPELTDLFIDENLEAIYHRPNLSLKIFYYTPYLNNITMYECVGSGHMDDIGENVVESTKVQNIFSVYGLAPRVYDLVWLKDGDRYFAAQITDFIPHRNENYNNQNDILNKVSRMCEDLDIRRGDAQIKDVIGGKYVDFQKYRFRNDFARRLIYRANVGLSWGGSNIPYQSIEEMDIGGTRENIERNKLLEIDVPHGFTALDFGCNGGFFLRRAFDAGASYAVGVDKKRVIQSAAELNYYLGYFGIDFTEKLPEKEFDVAYMLAVNAFSEEGREKIFNQTKKVLFFEGHAGHKKQEYLPMLRAHFKHVDIVGYATDNPKGVKRLVIKATK